MVHKVDAKVEFVSCLHFLPKVRGNLGLLDGILSSTVALVLIWSPINPFRGFHDDGSFLTPYGHRSHLSTDSRTGPLFPNTLYAEITYPASLPWLPAILRPTKIDQPILDRLLHPR